MLESLDNPIWFALTTEHRFLTRSYGLARRYPADVSPLAALHYPTKDAFADLQRLVSPGEHVALFTASPFDVPADWQVDRSRWIDQMICGLRWSPRLWRRFHSQRRTFPKCWSSPLPRSLARSCRKQFRWETISAYALATGDWLQWPVSDYNPLGLPKSARCALIPNFAAADMRATS